MLPIVGHIVGEGEKKKSTGEVAIKPNGTSEGKTKRYAIIAVSVVIIILIIVGGMTTAMFLMQKSSGEMLEVINATFTNREDGTQSREEIKIDIKNNITETDIKKSDGEEVRIINDFKRGIAVYRAKTQNGHECYVGPLNRTGSMDVATLMKYKEQHPKIEDIEEDGNTTEEILKVSDKEIKDISVLGERAQDMCKGLKVFWMSPDVDGDDDEEEDESGSAVGSRQKRSACSSSIQRYGRTYTLYRTRIRKFWGRCRRYCYYYVKLGSYCHWHYYFNFLLGIWMRRWDCHVITYYYTTKGSC